jgi:hypothetical protein
MVSAIVGMALGLFATAPINKLLSSNLPESLISFTSAFLLYFAVNRILEKLSNK